MKKLLVALTFSLMAAAAFGQSARDTLIYHLPVVNGSLVYKGSGTAKGRDKKTLDSLAKKWLISYFKDNQLSGEQVTVMPIPGDTTTLILYGALLNFKVKPGMVNISYLAVIDLKINVADNYYSYQADHILFRPKSNVLNAWGYQRDPQYLIRVYKKEHLGLATAMDVTRNQIRDYLSKMNAAVRDCIASLNKAMTN